MPSRPSEATARPITAPPLKAMPSARAWPLERAASEVRTLALVAAFIPKRPAAIEQLPPRMYAIAVCAPTAHASSSATMRRNGTSTMYSRLRKAMAPVSISPARSCIAAVPAEWRLSER